MFSGQNSGSVPPTSRSELWHERSGTDLITQIKGYGKMFPVSMYLGRCRYWQITPVPRFLHNLLKSLSVFPTNRISSSLHPHWSFDGNLYTSRKSPLSNFGHWDHLPYSRVLLFNRHLKSNTRFLTSKRYTRSGGITFPRKDREPLQRCHDRLVRTFKTIL